uniref:DNA mismatch repair proteins mutS family domain-containing protein n=1 Tax=Opuntia streptacantha TaxID=393608 RepID=A0A7C9AH75_OPUST
MYGENISDREITQNVQMLREKVTQLEKDQPVPVDILIDKKTRVLLITGPNTGGKTICLKAVGLAAIMAKAGLYVLCSEPARMRWFDSVFADIGDDQSLSQSLSTFTGHLRQISDIQANSTSQSLVLLDEIGAGTNPLEGAALGMSILESFADAGALLTIATTHHGELKTLKYSNEGFENACMEFDEINLKPTYKILWGVPGRSNAINIAERLGLPKLILHDARKLYGAASAEIDEVIFELEKFKQDVEKYVHEAQHFLMLSKDLHEKLLHVQRKLTGHGSDLRHKKMRQISELASVARSTLHRKLQQYRASARQTFLPAGPDTSPPQTPVNIQQSTAGSNVLTVEIKSTTTEAVKRSSPGTITYNCLKCSLQGSNHFLSLKVQRVRVECLWLVTSFKFHPWGPGQLFLTWNHLKER